MLATFAFDVCHDVYRAAREVIDSKIPTLNMEASGKYTWRPDRMPRLAEYVADFARAGERALGESGRALGSVRSEASGAGRIGSMRFVSSNGRDLSRTGQAGVPVLLDGVRVCPSQGGLRASPSQGPLRASRMVMFRVFYLGGAEYAAARRHLGISELTWADWADEIRARVGRELASAGVFPPSKYFQISSLPAPENAA
jgi:hypothetical protein